MTTINEIISLLNEVCEDISTAKNLKEKIQQIVNILKSDDDLSMKINKASQRLDEISSNSELDSYCRTQLLGIVSALETVTE